MLGSVLELGTYAGAGGPETGPGSANGESGRPGSGTPGCTNCPREYHKLLDLRYPSSYRISI